MDEERRQVEVRHENNEAVAEKEERGEECSEGHQSPGEAEQSAVQN